MAGSKEQAQQVAEAAEAPVEPQALPKASRRNLLSTGSTLLNLACSGNPFGGFLKGKYYFMVGDSASGKTFLSMTCFAEATMNRHFKGYRFIYDNIEDGCLLDLEGLFNEQVADRVEPPAVTKEGEPVYSSTIEEFYYHLDDACKSEQPFIYVLDSMDALTSDAEEKKFDQQKAAHRKAQKKAEGEDTGEPQEKVAGSYGDGKAKKNSSSLRKILKSLRRTGSILIILCQTRDNVGSIFGGKTRSGGHALRFYATTEIWSSISQVLKKTVHGKARKIGVRVQLAVKKNRITGKLSEVEIDIYPSYGIDDTGSLVDFLVEEKWWETKKESIVAKELKITATREKLIRTIEQQGLQDEVRALAGQCWKGIDEACSLKRKKKYAAAE